MKIKLIAIFLVASFYASAQTFETTMSLAKYCKVSTEIESKTGFLISAILSDELGMNNYRSLVIEIDKNGDVLNKVMFNEHYSTQVENLFIINDSTYGALAVSHYGKDSLAKLDYYTLQMETGYKLVSSFNMDFNYTASATTDICLNKDSNTVCQVAFIDFVKYKYGFYFLEYNVDGNIVKSKKSNDIKGTRACIVPDTSTGYLCFEDSRMTHLDNNFETTEKFFFDGPATPYTKITDVIWENDSTLIYSIALIDGNPVYHMGLSRMRYGTEVVDEQRFNYTLPNEMYAYYNAFDTVGNYFYLAATTNFDGIGGQFDITDTTGIRIIKANKDFSVKWDRTYRRDANNFLYYIIGTADGGCMVAGTRYDFTQPEERLDLYLLKVDSLGNYTTVGIDEQLTSKTAVTVYPNPGQNQMNILLEANQVQETLNLYTIAGAKVLTTALTGQTNTIETSFLPNGIYIYEIVNENAVYSRGKWVKQ